MAFNWKRTAFALGVGAGLSLTTLAIPPAQAETPPNMLVMGMRIDDIITLSVERPMTRRWSESSPPICSISAFHTGCDTSRELRKGFDPRTVEAVLSGDPNTADNGEIVSGGVVRLFSLIAALAGYLTSPKAT